MVKQPMQELYANIECQILASSQCQALSQKHASDAVEARFRQSLEPFRIVPATEAERHIATENQLAAALIVWTYHVHSTR